MTVEIHPKYYLGTLKVDEQRFIGLIHWYRFNIRSQTLYIHNYSLLILLNFIATVESVGFFVGHLSVYYFGLNWRI